MTDQQEDTTPQTWVAIDIAKRRHVVLVEFGDGKRRHYRVQRQLEEVDRFVSFLHAQEKPIRIGFDGGSLDGAGQPHPRAATAARARLASSL